MIGVVADDITGSNDIGIMFAKNGYLVHVYSYDVFDVSYYDSNQLPDVLILNTESRFDSSDVAYKKVYGATEILKALGCSHYYKKTCSVFRGNIGAEFDAMLDALGHEFGVVVAGFPKNGRITKDGLHYVHGKLLEESEFKNDPVHPMLKSNLVEILQRQTRRAVGLVDFRQVKKGVDCLKEVVVGLKKNYNYLVFDVLDQNDLKTIAEATVGEKVFCGSSALAEELPNFMGLAKQKALNIEIPLKEGVGILCAAGSLMPQTARQVERFCQRGAALFELNTLKLFDPHERDSEIEFLISAVSEKIMKRQDAVVYSASSPDKVAATKIKGIEYGLSTVEIARKVSEAIAEVVEGVVQITGQNRLLIAGGDTSAAVCNRLGIKGMMVADEIQPGLPSCVSLSANPMLLVLKSGSFGNDDFFLEAVEYLKTR
ncbi:uncharacterized protein YgbK (DUF1537 family) [Caldicoprobacter guelmensis]|uniref:four-carbon acid sugar kinase family protein n=1 Tax=Caldicoprobacter guelmensis TaxID=1170224 RepID=UPI00195DA5D2|nr:four-carbon acid sugar kinase family protein [Caldicoprobacter guelmensis]MBM7582948.1 uncharacterized protein YgbK (DUF1537 family) [Caldicoprobacter guelmensis]